MLKIGQHLRLACARAFSTRSRNRKARFASTIIEDERARSVLLVGCEGAVWPWSNIVERAVIGRADFAVASGLSPHVELDAPKLICDGLRLPFRDGAFDLVMSNAVIEHVGMEAEQRTFVAEHIRVGRAVMITTPNRWFPIESHTRAFLLHWSRGWREKQSAHFSRLLSRREFIELVPTGATVRGRSWAATFVAVAGKGRGDASGRTA